MRMTAQTRRRSAVIAGAGIAALATTGVFAVPASAHTGDWSVTCDSVTVHLTAYNAHVTNSVTLSVVDGGVLASEDSFGSSYDFSGALPAHTSPIQVHLVVNAGDGKRYSKDEYKTSEPCRTPPTTVPPTTVPPTTTAPPTTVPPTTTAPPATGTTTAPPTTSTATSSAPAVEATTSPAAGNLAETGGSSSTPVIAGIAVAVVAAGGGLLFVNRRRRTAAHR